MLKLKKPLTIENATGKDALIDRRALIKHALVGAGSLAIVQQLPSSLSKFGSSDKSKPFIIRVGVSDFFSTYPEVLPVLRDLSNDLNHRSNGQVRLHIDAPGESKQDAVFADLRKAKYDLVVSSTSITDPSAISAAFFGMLSLGLSRDEKRNWLLSEEGSALWAEKSRASGLRSLYFGLGPQNFGQLAEASVWDRSDFKGLSIASRCHVRNHWYRAEQFEVMKPKSAEAIVGMVADGRVAVVEPLQHLLVSSLELNKSKLQYFLNDWSQSAPVFELVARDQWLSGLPQDIAQLLTETVQTHGEILRARVEDRERALQTKVLDGEPERWISTHSPLRLRFLAHHADWIDTLTQRNSLARQIQQSQALFNSAGQLARVG